MKKILLILIATIFVVILFANQKQINADMFQSITDSYTYFEDFDLVEVSLGYSHSSAITSEGRIFTWGYNYDGQLGDGTTTNRYTPTEINKIYSIYNEILLTYSNNKQNYLSNNIKVSIFPEYEIPDEIASININGTEYTNINNQDGRIDVFIPNTWNLNDTLDFTINSITFADGIVMDVTGDTTASTTIVEDTWAPTITYNYNYDLYVEVNVGDNSYIEATATDDTGDSVDVTITGTVDWTTAGDYELTYSATDVSGNVSTQTRTIHIMPSISDSGTIYGDMTFYYFDDETYSDETDLTNQTVRYNNVSYISLTDNSNYKYSLGENSIIYCFVIDDRYIILAKSVYFADTEPPTFDTIANQTIEVGVSDIDWSTYITNEADNSDGVLTKVEVSDNVDYDKPGTYTVTVKLVDESNNETSQTFNVTVEDTSPPTFDTIADQTIEAGTSDIDWSTYITNEADNINGVLTKIEVTDTVDYDTPGTYSVTVKLVDESNNEKSQTFNVIVEDTTAPTLALKPTLTTIPINSSFDDAGIVIDDYSETTTTINSDLDTSTIGTYSIEYSVTDTSGNTSTITRMIHVYNPNPQIIFTLHDEVSTLQVGDPYTDAGCSALINDETLDCNLSNNPVDTAIAGIYQVTYTVDYQGETYTHTRYVFVYQLDDDKKPILFFKRDQKEGDLI